MPVTLRSTRPKGQALILVMAIVLIASVVVFMVYNSGRAVNEKINLVNAADAAAYSGAQIAARQLNFMAYTNRAMLANELAVGHTLSLQMELDLAAQGISQIADQLGAVLGWIPILGAIVDAIVNAFAGTLEQAVDLHGYLVGFHATLIDANNALYSDLQYEAYRDLISNGVVPAAMRSVVDEYRIRAPILLNDSGTLSQFQYSEDARVASAAESARGLNTAFCEMVMFVTPGLQGAGDLGSNDVAGFCSDLASSGTEGAQSGSGANPMEDNGIMVGMLKTMVAEFGNAEWIRTRDMSTYRTVLGFQVRRQGSTTVEIDGLTGQLNWRVVNDTMRVGDPFFNLSPGTLTASGDISGLSGEARDEIDASGVGDVLRLMAENGLCEPEDTNDGSEPSCESVITGRYGGVRRYTYLNPAQQNPVITAFLSQSGCGDAVGYDSAGDQLDQWHDGPRFLEERRSFCNDEEHPTVYAVAQAAVFFERPVCLDAACSVGFQRLNRGVGPEVNELPNLFNPFWQARLLPQ